MPSQCSLHIYDVSTNPEIGKLNEYLTAVGTGAFHGGVEVYGKEYSFGYIKVGTGIFSNAPKGCTMHSFRESVDLGTCEKSEAEVKQLLAELEPEWPGCEYDLLRRNCVIFSAELAERLGVAALPSWVSNLAGAGASLQDGAMQAASAAQAAAIMAAAKAGEVNEKYDVSGQAAAKVSDMLVAAGELDEKYQFKQKAGEAAVKGSELAAQGAQQAAQKAQELDEKYHVKQQAGEAAAKGSDLAAQGAQQAAQKAQELDEKYKIKENASAAAKKGGAMAMEGAQKLWQRSWSPSAAADATTGAGAGT